MSGSQKCLYIGKDFNDRPTDVYHSDIKNAFVLRYLKVKFFLRTKNHFSNFAKFLKTKMLVRLKFFLQFVEKMKKLKLS